jgi:hypothetical protein
MAGHVSRSLRITCRGKTDGAGAQANACMSAMAFAEAAGIRYVHTPFSSIAHPEGEPAVWTQRWEEFFGLGTGEVAVAEVENAVDLKTFLNRPSSWRDENQIVVAQHFHGFCNRYPDAYLPILPRLREKYLSTSKPAAASRAGGEILIAVHIRRGDVSQTDAITAERFTDDRRILKTLRDCLKVMSSLKLTPRITIYSEGKPEDFAAFRDLGCELRIGTDPFETINNLVYCDILVMAKSAFSYVPALLSDAAKLYEPFWTKPMSDWIVLGPDGGFDEAALRAKLGAR